MAIRWMAGHETVTNWTTGATTPRPTYDGAVLGTTGRDVRIMSDVWAWMTYAEVWDGTTVALVEIACSEDSKPYGAATVDATPDVLAAVAAFRAAAAVKAAEAEAAARAWRRLEDAKRVARGKTVVVARGRKVKKGTTGDVFWMGEGHWGMRVGLKDAAGTVHWTAAKNVDVLDPAKYLAA